MACNRPQFGNPTRLYDAIDASVDALQDIEGRKVALVFTDGEDTRHAIGWREVLDKALADGVMIYTIGLESNYFNGLRQVRSRPDGRLKTLRRGNRRRVFRAEGHRRPGPDVHAGRARASPPVCRRSRTERPRRQAPRARGSGQGAPVTARARKIYIPPTAP